MAVIGETEIVLKRAGKRLALNIAPDESGAPRVELGDSSAESVGRGERGLISINSFDGGAGQLIDRGESKYEFSQRWDTVRQGSARTTAAQVKTEISTHSTYALSTLRARGSSFFIFNGKYIEVTPRAIFEDGVFKHPMAGVLRLSGSYAIFGDRIFFGIEAATGAPSTDRQASNAAVRRAADGTYANITPGVTVSHWLTIADRLYLIGCPNNETLQAWWTAETGTDTPLTTTDFPIDVPGYRISDVTSIGPHLLIALGSPVGLPGKVFTMSASGKFTDIMPRGLGASQPLIFTPYLGGVLLFMSGRPRALWFRSLTDVVPVEFDSFAYPNADMTLATTPIANGLQAPGVSTMGDDVYLAAPARLNGSSGIAIIRGTQRYGKWAVHQEGWIEDTSLHVESALVYLDSNGKRKLRIVTQDEDANLKQRHELALWESSGVAPSHSTNETEAAVVRSARLSGNHWTTKKGLLLKGFMEFETSDVASGVTINIYLDNEYSTPVYSTVIESPGPFYQKLPSTVMGRLFAIEWVVAAGEGPVVVELPIDLEYMAVPGLLDTASFPVVAGRGSVLRTGKVDAEGAKSVEARLRAACDEGEVWTLQWGDKRPDWKVIPLKLRIAPLTEEIEGTQDHSEICWLEVQRV